MKVLITGDTGFIGKNMKNYLENIGIETIGYSRRNGYDIFNKNLLEEYIKKSDIVIHFAAEAKPGESILTPIKTIDVNIKGSLNVLEGCRKYNKTLIYPSSCEIYGNSEIPIKEDFPLNPTNPYAASKAAIDRFCYMYYKAYNLDVKIVRFFNPYGPYQQLNKIMPTFFRQAMEQKPITVFNDGSDTRDYVYVEDIVRGTWLSKDLPPGEAVNLATGIATTNLQIAQLIKKLTNSDSPITFVNYPKLFGGIKKQVGNYDKAKKLLNWKPNFSLEEGVKKTIEWLKNVYNYE
jgi:nucleoside-diphosphate-sugar epimerase